MIFILQQLYNLLKSGYKDAHRDYVSHVHTEGILIMRSHLSYKKKVLYRGTTISRGWR